MEGRGSNHAIPVSHPPWCVALPTLVHVQIYVELVVALERPRFEYSPAHACSLVDLLRVGRLLCPPRVFMQVASSREGDADRDERQSGRGAVPRLAWWDTARSMIHGKFDAILLGGR